LEKIQQAIERARRQRAGMGGQMTTTAAPAAPTRSPVRPASKPASALAAALKDVSSVRLSERHLRENRLLALLTDDRRADVFRKLRTQALMRLQTLNGRSIAVVSARDGEGKTLVACNLALSVAHRGGTPTFLLDMDFRRPSVYRALGIEPKVSLSDVIEGSAELADAVVRIADTELYVLPQGRAITSASELIASARARAVLQELLAALPNAILLVDCPPLLQTDEPLVVQGYVDGCLLVVQQGRTTRDDVQRATEHLDEAKYLGSVLNRAAADEASGYYGYR